MSLAPSVSCTTYILIYFPLVFRLSSGSFHSYVIRPLQRLLKLSFNEMFFYEILSQYKKESPFFVSGCDARDLLHSHSQTPFSGILFSKHELKVDGGSEASFYRNT